MKLIDFTRVFLVFLAVLELGSPVWAKNLPRTVSRQTAPPPGERALAGTENNPNMTWIAVTDRDSYAHGETLLVKVTNSGYKRQRFLKNVWIENFIGRRWTEQLKIKAGGRSRSLAAGNSAEFSWTIPEDQAYGKYRLVIFTSRDFSVPPVFSNEFYVR